MGWVGVPLGGLVGHAVEVEFPACFLAHPDCKSSILYVV